MCTGLEAGDLRSGPQFMSQLHKNVTLFHLFGENTLLGSKENVGYQVPV